MATLASTEFEYEQLFSKKPEWKELNQAVWKGDVETINQLVAKNQINLRAREDHTRILLKTAIQKDNGKVLEVLFEKGAKVSGILFTAVRKKAFECVKTIVKRLKTDKEDADDLDPTQKNKEGFLTPLMMALQSNSYEIVEYFIVKGYNIKDDQIEGTNSKMAKKHEVIFRFNTYQARANPLYICYMFIHDKTIVNPLFEIFELNKVLLKQSR